MTEIDLQAIIQDIIILAGIIAAGVTAKPIVRMVLRYRKETKEASSKITSSQHQKEYIEWLRTALMNPNVAAQETQKKIQEMEQRDVKGWDLDLEKYKLKVLEFAIAHPKIAQLAADNAVPGLVKTGFALWNKGEKILAGMAELRL